MTIRIQTTPWKYSTHFDSYDQVIQVLYGQKIWLLFDLHNKFKTTKDELNFIKQICGKDIFEIVEITPTSYIEKEISELEIDLKNSQFNKDSNVLIKSSQIEKFINFLMETLSKKGFTNIASKTENLEISMRNFLKVHYHVYIHLLYSYWILSGIDRRLL